MILECKSCNKKFVVPDNAITSTGRLVQCSSCGNKWTQFPIKKKAENKPGVIATKIKKEETFNPPVEKKKKVKKRTGPSIYSKEYLAKKHGIKIGENNLKASKIKSEKNYSQSNFGFYSFLIVFIIFILSFIGILNLTKEIVIYNFPFTENFIEILFENLNNFIVLFKDSLNLY